jgi:hypothetical protein
MFHSLPHACYVFIEFSLIWLPHNILRLRNKLLNTHPTPAHVAPRLKKEHSYISAPPLCLQGRLWGEPLSSWRSFSSILFLSAVLSPVIFTGRLICPIHFVRVGVWTRRACLPLSKLIRYGQTVEWRRWRHANIRCTVHDSSLNFVNRTLWCVFKKQTDFSQTLLCYFI